MGRPCKPENKEYIASATYKLFIEKGYNKTTYQNIADSIGTTRTLTQYYFPKKEELMNGFFNKLLFYSEKYIEEKSLKTDNVFINLYLIGQIYFSFLQMNEKVKIFTLDIIDSRTNTEEILLSNEEWAFEYMNIIEPIRKKDLSDDVVMIVGGAYELIYRYIKKGSEFNVANLIAKIMVSFMTELGYENNISSQMISNYALDKQTLKDSNAFIENEFLSK